VDSAEKLHERVLTPQASFYSRLNECAVSDEDYKHASEVWDVFGIKTLGKYAYLYLKIDVLLLADIFENFRELCLLNYKLDSAYYFTSAGLALDAALRYTRARLVLLEDYDMHLMIENVIRGDIAQCCKRYIKAKNPYLGKEGDTYIMYLDMNNLYGGSLSQYLPTGGFEWIDQTLLDLSLI
jgi:hypothetical protein